jgi:hypothetical protein
MDNEDLEENKTILLYSGKGKSIVIKEKLQNLNLSRKNCLTLSNSFVISLLFFKNGV